jgi:1,4-alpha-glucan branching enzyme
MKKLTKKGVGTKKAVVKKSPATTNTISVKGLKKQYLKKSASCKVTFRLPKEAAPAAEMVSVVGDFNNWDVHGTQMQKLKSGDFKATIELPCNNEFRFRYLIDEERWENDWAADKYLPNAYGDDDSVVVIENGNLSSS